MVLTPVITTEDVRLALNGTYSGSDGNYYFWSKAITSGSVLAQVNLASYTMFGMLGKSVMESTEASNPELYYHLRVAQLDISCFRVLVTLSGNVITDGVSWSAGVQYSAPHMMESYRYLIETYAENALYHLKFLQPMSYMTETTIPGFRDTQPSMM